MSLALRASCFILVFFLATPAATLAERKNELTGVVDVGGSIDDNPFVDQGGLSQVRAQNYGWAVDVYPTIGVVSSTPESRFSLDYSFGYERYESTLDLTSESHRVAAQYQGKLSSKWGLRVREAFTRSPDYTSFLAFRGATFTPEGVLFDYVPVALRRQSYSNGANLGLDWSFSSRSTLAFDIRHSYRHYDDAPGFNLYPDQQSYGAGVEYRNKATAKTTWTLGYRATQFEFERFGSTRNQDLLLGIERELRPSLSLRLKGGPSYAETVRAGEVSTGDGADNGSFLGYNLDLGLNYSAGATTFRLFARRDNQMSSGIGSVSIAHSVGLDFARKLSRRLIVRLTATGYDYQRQLDNLYEQRGIISTLQFEVPFSRHVGLTTGASYQTQKSDYVFSDLERRRVFVSVRFYLTELLKGIGG